MDSDMETKTMLGAIPALGNHGRLPRGGDISTKIRWQIEANTRKLKLLSLSQMVVFEIRLDLNNCTPLLQTYQFSLKMAGDGEWHPVFQYPDWKRNGEMLKFPFP